MKAKIKITTADQINAFTEQEREALKETRRLDHRQRGKRPPLPEGHLRYRPVLPGKGRRACHQKMFPKRTSSTQHRALHANIVAKPEALTAKDLGTADLVEEDTDGNVTKISGLQNPKTITILLRGTSDYLLDELERAVVDGTRVVMDAMEDGTYVVGGAAVETELLMKIRDYAQTVGDRSRSPSRPMQPRSR